MRLPSCSPCRDHRGPWPGESRMWLDLVYKGWGCSVVKVPSHEWFSLHMAGTKVHKEVWPPSSLFSSSLSSLICFIFCPLTWLMSDQMAWVSEEGEFPFRPPAQATDFLTGVSGTLCHNPRNSACLSYHPLKLHRKGELLNVGPGVPHPQCLTGTRRTQIFVELRELRILVTVKN